MDYTELKKLMSEQKVEMTAAERIKAYNEGKEVDHIPYTLQAPDPAMADIFGFTTPQAIYKWQHGTAMPTIDNLVVLAAVLDVTIDEILVVQREDIVQFAT